jgi:hypothetical protein
MTYEPTLESVRTHPVPDWFHDAKLGIFIHWGLYSVPAWAPLTGELGKVIAEEGWARWFAHNPYAEWYMKLFAHYYNSVPEGVINDRFSQSFGFSEGQISGGQHKDFRTPEYAVLDEITEDKWEATRGIGYSFGYNQNEGPDNYLTVEELVRSFVDIVSKNGNLLLNMGPMADGMVPDLQRECLLGLGRWLAVDGEAIFSTRPWVTAESRAGDGIAVRFTQRGDSLYATLMDTPTAGWVAIDGLEAVEGTAVTLLGNEASLAWEQRDEGLAVLLPKALPVSPAHVVQITPQPRPTGALLSGGGRLSLSSTLQDLLDDKGGRAVLEKHLSEMLAAPQMKMAAGFSLKQIAQYVPSLLTLEKLDQIAEDLAEL